MLDFVYQLGPKYFGEFMSVKTEIFRSWCVS